MKIIGQTEADIAGKKYFTISEVAEMFGLSVEVLRKWEKDFPNKIRPQRTSGKTRLYKRKDIEQIQLIYRMRHTEGRTIEGVRSVLNNNPGQEEVKQEVITHLYSLRSQLQSIVNELEGLMR